MKRRMLWVLIIALLLPVVPVEAGSIVAYQENTDLGKVIEVIDGEVMKVFFYRRDFKQPSVELIRVIGLKTEASDEAFAYGTNRLLGKTVYFLYDDRYKAKEAGMTYAHVFVDYDKTYAEEVLSLGYGVVEETAKGARFYHDFMAAQYSAQIYELGRWRTSLSQQTDRININTAAPSLLKETLGLTDKQATDVKAYREKNPFNDIFEIMAVDYALDGQWFDQKSHLMSVVTNMNQTSHLELKSLMPSYVNTDIVLNDLDNYLRFNQVTKLDDLHKVSSFSGYLSVVKPFITLEATNVYKEANKKVANVNTVSEGDFVALTGLTKFDYSKLLKMRQEGKYVITSLAELYRDKSHYIYNQGNAHVYNNLLTAMTDTNTAAEFEIRTLLSASTLSAIERQNLAKKVVAERPFLSHEDLKQTLGSTVYASVAPYMYLYKEDIPTGYNPNTARKEDVDALKLKYKGVYTNYTNVNTASKEGLLDLHKDMTVALVEDILTYRARYPFRNNDDLYQLFVKRDKKALYTSIAYFLSYE